MIKAIADSLLSIAFPQNCRVCNASVDTRADGVACSSCWGASTLFTDADPLCAKCGGPLDGRHASAGAQCAGCIDHHYARAAAGGVYAGALAATVIELKSSPHLPDRPGRILVDAFERARFERPDLLIPVPLSAKRMHERAFNQAEVLAHRLSKATGIPVDTRSIERSKHTPIHRAGMDRKAREMSVRNIFKVVRPKLVAGRSILLVDDIFTTGATVSYCAKALKKSGAGEVNVLTLARAARIFD